MEQTLTVVCKLRPTPEQSLNIERFLKAFADACNFANKTVQPTVTNKITIQNRVYQELRSRFELSANQAVRVCARVGANRKTAKLKSKYLWHQRLRASISLDVNDGVSDCHSGKQ